MKLSILLPLISALALPRSSGALPRGGSHTARQEAAGLNTLMQQHGKYFGTFSDGKYLDDTNYTEILGQKDQFEVITPGNSMKWDTTEV